jgi:predicted dehydrogenase
MACARDLRRLSEAVPSKTVRLVGHPEEVYADPSVDAVAICVPNTQHYVEIKAALTAGKHVMCEYPLTDHLDQYDELVALAQAQGKVLHHSLTPRAESLHLAMKGALDGLGAPRSANYRFFGGPGWYCDPRLRGDMFCALHIHFIDQFVDFFGQPERIMAHGTEKDMKPSAVVTLYWPDGLVGTIDFGMGFTDSPSYMGTVMTTDGWCEFHSKPEMTLTVSEGGQVGTIAPPPDTSKVEDAASFLDEILGTGVAQCDLETGRNAIALSLACSRQLQG